MNHFSALFFLALTFLGVHLGRGAEAPTITISKSDKLAVAIGTFVGPDGASAAKILQNDLILSGAFNLVPVAGSGLVIAGVSSGGGLVGSVTDRSGKTVLNQTFSGTARGKVHAFADAIVDTLSGARGFANTKVAFVSNHSGHQEIYVADADGAGLHQLTNDGSISVGPRLSPDGRTLLYTGYKSGYADVYEIDLSNGARNRIIKFPGTNTGASYSADRRQLAVVLSKDGNPELYSTNASGGGARRLTRTLGVESTPTWSPDGSEIIYSSDDRGTPQLYRISASGGSGRAIATGHNYNTEANWSPDGKRLAFTVRDGGTLSIATMDLAGGSVRVLTAGEGSAWGADSRHLIFADGGSLMLFDVQTGEKHTLVSGLGKISETTWSR
ncbi:MAG: biopolymer transporter Tol [Verrucomicrobia bacterium]|nr:biopolymer transporter Tol [Verrucomicrobiota bacterium]